MQIRNFTDIKAILLDNTTIKQTIFKNTFWIALAIGISKFSKFVLIVYVTRILGATEYGKFTFALAFISLFIVFSDLGLSEIVTREFSREKKREKEFFSILSLKLLLSVGTLILILIGSFFVTPDSDIRKIIWILAIFGLINHFYQLVYAFFRARQRMEYEAGITIFEALTATTIGFFVIFNFPSVINLSYAYLFSALIGLIFILVFFHFKVLHLKIFWKRAIWKKFLGMSWPLALTSLFGTIYVYIDSVMMGYWGQITETGWYSAAYKIVITTTVPMGFVILSFYPVLSKLFEESKEKLQRIWNYEMETMIILAMPLMAGGIILAPQIIDFLYGQGFAPSILAFQILILMSGITFLVRPLMQILVVSNQQRKLFWGAASGAAINIILNLILIPKFSLYGAAVATVITYILIFLLYFKFTLKFTSIQPLNSKIFLAFLGAILSSLIMSFVISRPQIYYLNVCLLILIGVGAYFITLFVLSFALKHFKYIYVQK